MIIERPRLMKKLDESTARTILLLAPAGYGKTTLARQWNATLSHAVWLTLTPAHRDVTVIARDLADSLEAAGDEGFRDFIEQYIRARPNPQGDAALVGRVLAEAINRTKTQWVIVDDYHDLGDVEEAHLLVETLLEKTSCRFMVASRTRPPWATARREIYGDESELTQGDLSMREDEAEQALGASHGTRASVIALADGWPAVLQLAAAVPDLTVPERTPKERLHRYLSEEFLSCLSESGKELLLDAALDGRLSTSVETRSDDARYISVMLDETGAMHRLLRDFLLAKLGETTAGLSRVGRAVSDALAAEDWLRAFELISRFSLVSFVDDALSRALRPLAERSQLWTLVDLLRDIEAMQAPESPFVIALRAEIATATGEHEQMGRLAARAHHLLPAGHELHPRLCLVEGNGHIMLGQVDDAMTAFRASFSTAASETDRIEGLFGLLRAERFAERPSDPRLSALAEAEAARSPRARVLYLLNRHFATKFQDGLADLADLEECLVHIPALSDPRRATAVLHATGYAYGLRGDYDRAAIYAARLHELLSEFDLGFVRPYAHWLSAFVALGRRQFARCERDLRRLERDISLTYLTFHDLNHRALQARLFLSIGRIADAAVPVEKEFPGYAIPLMRGEYLAARALVLAISGDQRAALKTAAEVLTLTGAPEATVPAKLAVAIVALAKGDLDPTRDALLFAAQRDTWDPVICSLRAYAPFTEAAASLAEVRPLLRQACERAGDHQLARRLGLQLISAGATSEGSLSRREREVLELMSQGLRNPEIAGHLFISESTVKVHVRHIFEKLGVRTRAQAVARVTQRD